MGMIKLAENKKAPKWFIYKNIIIKWFELEYNCRYGYTKEMIADYDRYGDYDIERKELVDKMEYFKGECEKLAKIITSILKIIEPDSAKIWQERVRSENFDSWFKNSPSDDEEDE